jgi:prepilin-type N-terminal cleavage/methylation domain-containing protein
MSAPFAVGRRGFTLIEVLAALALTATVILALTLAVGVIGVTWGHGGRTAAMDEAVGRAVSRFHDDVASLVPWRYVDDDRGMVAFDGEPGALIFAAVVRTGAYGTPQFRLVRYRFVTGADGFDIERSTAPMPDNPRRLLGAWTESVRVLAGVGQPRLAFADSTGAKTVWRDSWPAGPALPGMVRLSFIVGNRVVVIEAPLYADAERDCLVPNLDVGCEKSPGDGKTAAAGAAPAKPDAQP